MIVRRHLAILEDALNGETYLDMASGGINNEEEEYYGLAQGNILDGFLYRTLRRNWLFNTGGDIVT